MADAAGALRNYVAFIDSTFAAAAPGQTWYERFVAAQKRHYELLAKHQVRAGAMTTFWFHKLTEAEAAMLNRLSPAALLAFWNLKSEAEQAARDNHKTGLADGHRDAFRHVYWTARMAQLFGAQWAKEYTTAHEQNPEDNSIPVAMDLHNNEVGLKIAEDEPKATREQLVNLAKQAVNEGRTLVIDDSTHFLMPSNEVLPGQTYDPEKKWLSDPRRGGHPDPGPPSATSEY